MRNGAQHKIIRVETIRPVALDALNLRIAQTWLNCANDAQTDFVLQCEEVFELAVIALSPNMCSRCGVDELRGDAHAVCRLAYATFEHIADAEFATDLFHVDRPTFVGKRRIARDNE